MAKWGKCDFSEFEAFAKQLEKLSADKIQEINEACIKELAARLLKKVIKRTLPGKYPKKSGKVGGTLRRGWTGGKTESADAYAQSISVQRVGDTYQITIINPVEYASYVEYGHRTASHTGWVNGKFMMTISAKEVQDQAPAIIEKKLEKMMREAFDGQ